MDKENELWKFAAVRPKVTTIQSYLFWLPVPAPWPRSCWINYPERAMQWDFSCSLPPLQTLLPSPINCLCNALYRHLSSRSATGAEINGTGPDGCLPELDMFPLLQVMCLWYMCFCAEVFFFSVLRLYSKWSIVWGVKFFFSSSLSSCKSCIS